MAADSDGGTPSQPVEEAGARSADVHVYRVLIRESHLDTFGHVNNATYLQLFEEARWDLITERGYGMSVIFEQRRGPVILDATVRFVREVKNRETLRIETQLEDYRGRVGHLRQRAHKEDGALACDALFTLALWDIDRRKIISPTDAWLRAVDPSGSIHQADGPGQTGS